MGKTRHGLNGRRPVRLAVAAFVSGLLLTACGGPMNLADGTATSSAALAAPSQFAPRSTRKLVAIQTIRSDGTRVVSWQEIASDTSGQDSPPDPIPAIPNGGAVGPTPSSNPGNSTGSTSTGMR